MKRTVLFFLLGLISLIAFAQHGQTVEMFTPHLIPAPITLTLADSCLFLPTTLSVDEKFSSEEQRLLSNYFNEYLKIDITTSEKGFIVLRHDKTFAEEQYRIQLSLKGIEISASTAIGRMWGVQTLCQLLAQAGLKQQGSIKYLPLMTIDDAPKYRWRGFHIDLSRHFFTKEFVMTFMENMALYKLNKLHLHLSDDQGWRVEMKRYPRLTSVGGFRSLNHWDSICIRKSQYNADMKLDKRFMPTDSIYGGFYTQQEIRELVAFGEKLGIEIIPEIDMPGHLSAAIRAYPFLSCMRSTGWGKEFSAPMCTANPQSIEFACAVLGEIADLFPSKYVHIGADEIDKENWKICPQCQALMKKNGMKSEVDLQTYFVKQMNDYLANRGKKTIVWDDAYNSENPQPLTYMYWRDWIPETPQQILEDNLQLIFTSWDFFYLSSFSNDRHLKGLYEYSTTKKYHIEHPELLYGYQACLWTEEVPTESRFEYQVYPALQAFAERAWGTTEAYTQFRDRLRFHLRMMDKKQMTYRVPNDAME